MNRGSNTLGYGKTKEVVIKGHKAGLTMTEIAKRYGLSRPAVNNCAYRNGLKFPYVKMKQPYGTIKRDVITAAEQGKTVRQIMQTYGYTYSAIQNVNRDFNLNIPKA